MSAHARSAAGMALIVMLLAMGLLSALGVTLVLTTTAEIRIAANFRNAQQALYAADAAAERAIDDLATAPDWNALLAGGMLSSFVDGPPSGPRQVDGGATVDLAQAVAIANCQKLAGCSDGDMDAVTEDRPWGPNNPRWKLFAYGRLRDLLPADSVGSPHYVIVMVADDPGETDNDPMRDAVAGSPGSGILSLRAEAFGPGEGHVVVELTVMRGNSAMRVLSWRAVR